MQLTVLFTDICGSTQMSRYMELEHFEELLDVFFEICKSSARRHGGQLTRGEGDGALIVFGLEGAREDDSRRACEAALEIHDQLRRASTRWMPSPHRARSLHVELHSGIHSGVLLVAEGRENRDSTDLIGAVANTSKKLAAAAERGQIIASLSSLGPYRRLFETLEPELVDLSLPRSCAIIARHVVDRRFGGDSRRGRSPLGGRDRVLDSLRRFALDAVAAAPRCLVVVGDAGYGKTRVLEEFCERTGDQIGLFLRGTCEGYPAAEPLQPFQHMHLQVIRMRQATSIGKEAVPPMSDLVRATVFELVDRFEPVNAASADGDVVGTWLQLFRALSAVLPLGLVIDDWQWADDASRQLLDALQRMPGGPKVILGARPRVDATPWISAAIHVELEPLQQAETGAIVQRWIPDAGPFLADDIHAYAGGVPLFVEEFCHAERVGQPWRPTASGGSVQAWVASLVASRVDQLPEQDIEALRTCAVIGNVVPIELLERLDRQLFNEEAANRFARADLMFIDTSQRTWNFKHGVTRDAIYERIDLEQRKDLHHRVVACLEQRLEGPHTVTPDALAYHSRGSGRWTAAAHYAELAGDGAMAAYALDRARAHYLSAIDALARLPDTRQNILHRCMVANKLGMASIFDPISLASGLDVFVDSVELARRTGDDVVVARCIYWLGYMAYAYGKFGEAVKHLRKSLALADHSAERRLAAQVRAALGQALAGSCEYDEALGLLAAAVEAKRRQSRPGGGVAIGSAYALACRASVAGDRGDFSSAQTCCDEALRLLGESTHPVANSVRNWICLVDIWQGRWAEADAIATASARIAESTRALLLLAACRSMKGYVLWVTCRDENGFGEMREAVQWMGARNGEFYTSLHYGWLTEACVAEGQVAEARRYASMLLRRVRKGDRLGEGIGCRAMALAAATAGDAQSASRWLNRAVISAKARASRREAALNEAIAAQIALKGGDVRQARERCAAAIDVFERLDMAWHAGTTRAFASSLRG